MVLECWIGKFGNQSQQVLELPGFNSPYNSCCIWRNDVRDVKVAAFFLGKMMAIQNAM